MGIFDPDEVITIYSIREAVEQGALVEVFRRSWEWLSGGKPVVVSVNMYEEITPEEMREVWNGFVEWRRKKGKAYPRSSGGTKYGDGAGWLG